MSSTLDPNEGEPQIVKETANTTGTLGPSDSSDSGSDVAGAKRHDFDRDTELDNHALETGDSELASDTDRAGTGERAAADGDSTLEENSDIDVDRIDDPYRGDSDESVAGERLADRIADEGEASQEDEAGDAAGDTVRADRRKR
ncbi:chemotaxis protein [Paraburkholderia sp. SARCC-3016]|nr:chemotaxis protein [Paraburkholderia sp. SARCC-3016]MDQ7977614.1 chemotaxis protein [Paraburkholderia sp. SARCC-3016]